jgi:tetratricopeptide (TPR) repeat protein
LSIGKATKRLQDSIFQYNRRNIDEAKEGFLDVLTEDPTNPEANYYLGLIYAGNNDDQKAVIHLKAVVDSDAYFLFTQQCRMILAWVYYKNREFSRAEQELLTVLEGNTRTVQIYAALSAVLYKQDRREEALIYAERAYEMDPMNINSKNTYGYLLCDLNENIAQGLEMLREVIRIKPDNPAYLDSLGWAYYKKGDLGGALASLKRAITIDPENEDIQDHYKTVAEEQKGTRQ